MLGKPLTEKVAELMNVDKVEVPLRFEERDVEKTHKAVTSTIFDTKANSPVFFTKTYRHKDFAQAKNEIRSDPEREYKVIEAFNREKFELVPVVRGYIPEEVRLIEDFLTPNMTIEKSLLEDLRKVGEIENEASRKLSLLDIRKEQTHSLNRMIAHLVAFQYSGEEIRKGKNGFGYDISPKTKESVSKKLRKNLENMVALKRDLHGPINNTQNGIDSLINEIVGYLWDSRNANERNRITHGDYGPHNITTGGKILDLADFGLDYEVFDFAMMVQNPVYGIQEAHGLKDQLYVLNEDEMVDMYFEKFLGIKHPEKFGDKSREQIKQEDPKFYADHLRTLLYNVIRQSSRVLGIMSRNIVENRHEEKRWIERYTPFFDASDLIKHYFNRLNGAIHYTLKHSNSVFYLDGDKIDQDAYRRIEEGGELLKGLIIPTKAINSKMNSENDKKRT